MMLSVIIPVYNEEDTIPELLLRLNKVFHQNFINDEIEVIFIDDGSRDRSIAILNDYVSKDNRIKILQFSRNFGHHIAITAGIDHASGDYIVMMDGDLQDQPEEIIKLYRKLCEGFDVVYGQRSNRKCPWWERVSSRLFVKMMQFLINERIEINSTIFRIMTRQVAEEIKKLREHNRYIVGLIGWVGFKHASVPVVNGKRFAGTTHYGFIRRMKLALDAIFSFSDFVLRLISKIGMFLVSVGGGWALYIIYRWAKYGQAVQGWASIMVAMLFFSGLQIFILGILAEYMSRLYMESKQRPLYVLRSKINFVEEGSLDL